MTKTEIRFFVLQLLMEKPMKSESLARRIKTDWIAVEDVLRELVKEYVIIPQGRKFYLRNREKTLTIINEIRYAQSA